MEPGRPAGPGAAGRSGAGRARELVPRPLMDRVAAGEEGGEVAATAVFVDLAGFTTTADQLARHGDHGAEVLAEMMASVFGPLVDAVYDWDGYVTGFSGDAIMAVFEGAPAHAVTAARLIATSVSGAGEHHSPYGTFAISGRVGVGTGTIRWRMRTSPDGRRAVYWVHGDATAAAVAAEDRAETGTLVLDEGLRGLSDADPAQPAPAAVDHSDPHPLAHLLHPPEILDTTDQFRPVVVAFVSVADAARLDSVIEDLFALQDRFGGRFSVEVADKGAVLMLVWGAPVAFEGDVERALELLLELHDRHPGLLRSGVSHGVAFAGFAGSPRREEYTVYGSQVNVAARLMAGAAVDEIRVTSAVMARSGAEMRARPLGVHQLKGIADPVAVFAIDPTGDRRPQVPHVRAVVGRGREMAVLHQALDPLAEGHAAGTMVVVGDAGVGKSHLVAATAAGSGATWLSGRSDPVWRRALGPLAWAVSRHLGLSRRAPRSTNAARLDAFLAERTELGAYRPFLAALVEVVDPGPAYEAVEPAERFRGIQAACVALMADLARSGPTVLLLEDLHWADPETLAFVADLPDRLGDVPFAVVATSRAAGILAGALEVVIDPLGDADVEAFAAEVLSEPVAPTTAAWLAERTGGNPFFVEQILLHLQEQDNLAPGAEGLVVVGGDDLPPTVGDVVVARLDALPPEVRHAVQTASVVGAELDMDVLEHVLQGPADEVCAAAAERGVWNLDGNRRIRFQHSLVRDAAYETLLTVDRTALHARTADAIAAVFEDSLEPHRRRLAHHHWHGGRPFQAARDGVAAARYALGLGAYREAVAVAEEGLERVPAVTDPERSELMLSLLLALGAGRIVTDGQSAPATREAYERAAALSEDMPEGRERFQALFGLRTFHQFAGNAGESRRLAEQCLGIASLLGEPDLLVQAHLMMGNTLFWAGELVAAAFHLDEVQRLAALDRHAAQVSGFAQNPRFTAVVPAVFCAWLRYDPAGAAAMVADAGRDAAELGHGFSDALVLQAAGFLHVLEDRPTEALSAGDALAALARAEEFPIYVAIAAVVQGWARARLGEVDAGLGLMQETIETLRARGVVIAQTLLGLLLTDGALRAGRRQLGRTAADAAIAAADATGERAWLAELLRLQAELADDPIDAAELRARSLETARAQGAEAIVKRVNADIARETA